MGCCGISVDDDKKKQNIQVFSNQSRQNPSYLYNKGNPKNMINSIELYYNTKDIISNGNNKEKLGSKGTLKLNNNINLDMNNNTTNINNINKDKIKPDKNIIILDNVKEYLPEDILIDEIEEMVFNALGNYIVDKSEYKKGINLTKEQAQVLCDILFNHICGDKKNINQGLLDNIKLKIGFCDVNRDNIKNIMFRGQNPTKEDIEDVYMQFQGSINPKLFVIELIE